MSENHTNGRANGTVMPRPLLLYGQATRLTQSNPVLTEGMRWADLALQPAADLETPAQQWQAPAWTGSGAGTSSVDGSIMPQAEAPGFPADGETDIAEPSPTPRAEAAPANAAVAAPSTIPAPVLAAEAAIIAPPHPDDTVNPSPNPAQSVARPTPELIPPASMPGEVRHAAPPDAAVPASRQREGASGAAAAERSGEREPSARLAAGSPLVATPTTVPVQALAAAASAIAASRPRDAIADTVMPASDLTQASMRPTPELIPPATVRGKAPHASPPDAAVPASGRRAVATGATAAEGSSERQPSVHLAAGSPLVAAPSTMPVQALDHAASAIAPSRPVGAAADTVVPAPNPAQPVTRPTRESIPPVTMSRGASHAAPREAGAPTTMPVQPPAAEALSVTPSHLKGAAVPASNSAQRSPHHAPEFVLAGTVPPAGRGGEAAPTTVPRGDIPDPPEPVTWTAQRELVPLTQRSPAARQDAAPVAPARAAFNTARPSSVPAPPPVANGAGAGTIADIDAVRMPALSLPASIRYRPLAGASMPRDRRSASVPQQAVRSQGPSVADGLSTAPHPASVPIARIEAAPGRVEARPVQTVAPAPAVTQQRAAASAAFEAHRLPRLSLARRQSRSSIPTPGQVDGDPGSRGPLAARAHPAHDPVIAADRPAVDRTPAPTVRRGTEPAGVPDWRPIRASRSGTADDVPTDDMPGRRANMAAIPPRHTPVAPQRQQAPSATQPPQAKPVPETARAAPNAAAPQSHDRRLPASPPSRWQSGSPDSPPLRRMQVPAPDRVATYAASTRQPPRVAAGSGTAQAVLRPQGTAASAPVHSRPTQSLAMAPGMTYRRRAASATAPMPAGTSTLAPTQRQGASHGSEAPKTSQRPTPSSIAPIRPAARAAPATVIEAAAADAGAARNSLPDASEETASGSGQSTVRPATKPAAIVPQTAALTPQRHARSKEDTPVTVRVNIGRIRIEGPARPAAPAKRFKRPAPALTLAQYAQRRNGRRA